MGALNLHERALALLDLCAAAGVRWRVDPLGDLEASDGLPEALQARVRALVGGMGPIDEAGWAKHGHAPSVAPPSDEERAEWRRAGPGHRAFCSVIRAPSRAAKELLGMPIASGRLKGLDPFTVHFSSSKGHECVATTSREAFAAAKGRGALAFQLSELDAMGVAVEYGRAVASDFERWAAAKQRGVAVTHELVGGYPRKLAEGERPDTALTFGELFDVLDLEIGEVEVHEPRPAKTGGRASARAAGDAGGQGGKEARGEVGGW